MADCLFCKILKGEIPSKKVFEDASLFAFSDIHPQAPTHVLIIPKKHFTTLNDLKVEDEALMGHMHLTAVKLAKELGIHEKGYRTVMNCNSWGGQTVYHIHMHLLGGRSMQWPPG